MPADECGEACERLLAGAADADKHHAAAVHGDDAVDAHEVLKGILEEHKLELADLVLLVVPLLELEALLAHDLGVRHLLVELGPRVLDHAVGVDDGLAQEVDEVAHARDLVDHVLPEHLADDVEDAVALPVLVRLVGQLVSEDTLALVAPQLDQVHLVLDRLARRLEEPSEDARKLAHVEEVVELGGGGEHLGARLHPQLDRGVGQLVGRLRHDLGHELVAQAPADDGPEDVVDGRERGHRHVEEAVLPLQAVRDVVAASAGVRHGRRVADVDKRLPLAGLVEVVDAGLGDGLAHDLVGDLVTPRVDDGHADVVDEEDALLATGRPVRAPLALLDGALERALVDHGRGHEGEGRGLDVVVLPVEPPEVHQNVRRLGHTGAASEEHGLALGHEHAEHALVAQRVECRDEELRELGLAVRGVGPPDNLGAPVLPLPLGVDKVLVARVAVERREVSADGDELVVELDAVLELEECPEGPAEREDEELLNVLVRQELLGVDVGEHELLEDLEAAVEVDAVRGVHDGLGVDGDSVEEDLDVLLDQVLDDGCLLLPARLEPREGEGRPP
mmetsp:Transcript_60189/g.148005  ORF Transcript_60189/g.148005 Transcript_60189/m.148005 type:complete len:563 (-) Transcript_60189:709-2397(-)